MRSAYASSGGVVSGAEIVLLLRGHSSQSISRVARWIVAREVVQFKWRGETLLPLFQFDLANMSVRPHTRRVIAELAPAFDDMDLAQWFVRPNSRLADALPVDLFERDLLAVLAAARADRLARMG